MMYMIVRDDDGETLDFAWDYEHALDLLEEYGFDCPCHIEDQDGNVFQETEL